MLTDKELIKLAEERARLIDFLRARSTKVRVGDFPEIAAMYQKYSVRIEEITQIINKEVYNGK